MSQRMKFKDLEWMMREGRTWHRHFLWEPVWIQGEMHWLTEVWRRLINDSTCSCCGRPMPLYEYQSDAELAAMPAFNEDPDSARHSGGKPA
jgi:hypothetical protein